MGIKGTVRDSLFWPGFLFYNALSLCLSLFRRFVPILMAQAKIYWDVKNYAQVEQVFL